MIELEIHGIARTPNGKSDTLLLLREKGGERVLPIAMSPKRAMVLLARSKFPFPLPMPISAVDIAMEMMRKFHLQLHHVHISHQAETVLLCEVVARRDEEEQVISYCQAADALILAVTAGCPILIDDQMLEAQQMRKVGEGAYALNINSVSREMLEQALQQAIREENYEAASQLRDELAKRNDPSTPDA